MYKVLIVDDEPLEREAMKLIFKKEIPGTTICGEAENGFAAIKMATMTNPDIILIDINMPKMDGLATIEKLQKNNINCKYIILTSYSSFEYARQALRLGVEDFLVKPADTRTVKKAVGKVIEDLKSESCRIQNQKKMKDRMDEMQPAVQSDIFRAICEKQKDIEKMFRLLDFHPAEAFITVMDSGDSGEILHNRICRVLDSKNVLYISRIHSSMIDFLFFNQSGNPNRKISECLEILTVYSKSLHIGCGNTVSQIDNLFHSYQQAVTALQHGKKESKKITFFKDIDHQEIFSFPIDRYIDLFYTQINLKDYDEIISLSELFFSDLNNKDNIDFIGKQTYVYQALIQIVQRISNITGYYRLWEKFLTEKNQLMESNDIASLKIHFLLVLQQLIDLLNTNSMTRQDQIVKKVMAYIDELYDKTISLEDLALSLNLSPSHLSKVIKKTTGMNFSEILNNFRINKAIRLLREDRMSIKEITFRVGYNSQHYFSRIFKRITGFSPSDFRNRDF